MKCIHCKGSCIKKGIAPSGIQKYQCRSCNKYQREEYKNNAWKGDTDKKIKIYIKEGCGIRSISRIMEISIVTVIRRIKSIAEKIGKPKIKKHKTYEMDELKTYVKRKKNEQWVIYAINKVTKQVVDFRIGKRNKRNIKNVIDTLLLSCAKKIYTDKLNIYPTLIPGNIHRAMAHNINYIERNNLNLRTHIKRLSRRTLCFSKSATILMAVMRIYFWG